MSFSTETINFSLLVKLPVLLLSYVLLLTICVAVAEMLDTRHDLNEDWLENAKQQLEKPKLCGEVRQMFLLNSAMYCLENNEVRHTFSTTE